MALAARGVRDLGHGEEPVGDAAENEVLLAQARSVYMRSGLLAVFGTVVLLLLPL